MSKRQKISINQMQLPIEDEVSPPLTPSKKSILNSILLKQEELRIGQLDFDRNRPSLRQWREAAAYKNSSHAKVDGEWYDVKFCKYLVSFMDGWQLRRSQLTWELSELKKELDR